MANEIVNTFKEMVDRLKAANVINKKLQNITLIEGPVDEVLENKTLPVVVYELISSGSTTDRCLGGIAISEFSVLLTCYTKVANGYYTDNRTGILDLYEKCLDVIDSGGTSLNGNGHWLIAPRYRVISLERTQLSYIYEIEVTLSSSKYTRGSLTG